MGVGRKDLELRPVATASGTQECTLNRWSSREIWFKGVIAICHLVCVSSATQEWIGGSFYCGNNANETPLPIVSHMLVVE